MFTGIVQGLCPVISISEQPGLARLAVELGDLAEGVQRGASVAVNGTCLTVSDDDGAGVIYFDVIQETLSLTNLGALGEGTLVNVERSMRVGDEIGGHQLSGHVIGTASLNCVVGGDNERVLWFDCPERWMRYLFYKGFVALDGASLTISGVDRERAQISVSLIPETIDRTTLGHIVPGDRVNLEVDYQAQAVVETLEHLLEDPDWKARLKAILNG